MTTVSRCYPDRDLLNLSYAVRESIRRGSVADVKRASELGIRFGQKNEEWPDFDEDGQKICERTVHLCDLETAVESQNDEVIHLVLKGRKSDFSIDNRDIYPFKDECYASAFGAVAQSSDSAKRIFRAAIEHHSAGLVVARLIQDRNLPLLDFGLHHGLKIDLDPAFQHGDLDFVDQLVKRGIRPGPLSYNIALRSLKGEWVDRAFDLIAPVQQGEEDNTLNCAVKTGHVEMVKKAVLAGARPGKETLTLAVKTKSREIVQIVIAQRAKPVNRGAYCTYNAAISVSDLDILARVRLAGAVPRNKNKDSCSFDQALRTKNVEVLKGVIKAGALPRRESLSLALSLKIDELIQITIQAARENLKAFQDSYSDFMTAVDLGDLPLMNQMISAGIKMGPYGVYVLNHAIRKNRLDMVQAVLRENAKPCRLIYNPMSGEPCTNDHTLYAAIKSGNVEIVRAVFPLATKKMGKREHKLISDTIQEWGIRPEIREYVSTNLPDPSYNFRDFCYSLNVR